MQYADKILNPETVIATLYKAHGLNPNNLTVNQMADEINIPQHVVAQLYLNQEEAVVELLSKYILLDKAKEVVIYNNDELVETLTLSPLQFLYDFLSKYDLYIKEESTAKELLERLYIDGLIHIDLINVKSVGWNLLI